MRTGRGAAGSGAGMAWTASMTLHVTDEFVDPQLESYCDANPEEPECLVYED